MTGTDLCVNKPHMSRSYLNHLVHQLWDSGQDEACSGQYSVAECSDRDNGPSGEADKTAQVET